MRAGIIPKRMGDISTLGGAPAIFNGDVVFRESGRLRVVMIKVVSWRWWVKIYSLIKFLFKDGMLSPSFYGSSWALKHMKRDVHQM